MRGAVATTRGLVLDVVRMRRAISRVELAEVTGLTQATISTTVRSLLDDGLLTESGAREFTGGKPRVMLELNPRSRCAVGVALGADWIVITVVDAAGSIVARMRVQGAREEAPELVISRVAAHVDTLFESTGLPAEVLMGLGLAAPGVVNIEAGAILESRSMSHWQNFPVREALAEATGLDVVLDNNAAAAAIGEFWGGGIGAATAHCTIFMGASIGAGIVLNGSVYRGASGNAGAVGPLRLGGAAPGWNPLATVEEQAGPRAVAARVRSAIARGRTTAIDLPASSDNPFADFAAVATAAIHGDPLGVALIEESAEFLVDAVLLLANVLDLDSVVLAGPSFSIAGSIYQDVVSRRLDADFYARSRHGVSVRLSAQISDAAAIGSAALVLQRELAPRH